MVQEGGLGSCSPMGWPALWPSHRPPLWIPTFLIHRASIPNQTTAEGLPRAWYQHSVAINRNIPGVLPYMHQHLGLGKGQVLPELL